MVSYEELMKYSLENDETGYNYPNENTYPIINKTKNKKTKSHYESPSLITEVPKEPKDGLTQNDLKEIQEYEDKKKHNKIILMNCKSELVKKPNGKYTVDTEINIKKDLEPKVKRALIKSIIGELNNVFDDCEFFYKEKN